jgi:hypothetical protein
MRRNLVLSILALLLITVIAGTYIYREYNRRNIDVVEMNAAFSINATELISAFSKDSATANAKYLVKIIEVKGFVKSVDKDPNGSYTISLGDSATMSSVRCSMNADTASQSIPKITGTSIVIKGVCTGFMADDMGLGADVILNRSVIKK